MKKAIILLFIFQLSFGAFAQKTLNVFVFVAEECPISIFMARPLKEAMNTFGEQANFYAVFPNIKSNEATAAKFLEDYELNDFKVLLDPNQEISKKYQATITPEAIITDESGTVLYRGRISNAYKAPGRMKHGSRINELKVYLTRILRGETIPQPWKGAVGCYITFHTK